MSYASAVMCYEAIICPRCSSASIVKNGKTSQRKQRYLRKDCRTAYPRRVRDLEMDEFWSFVGAKRKQRWTWYGYDRQRRKVVAFVNERRTDAACRQLLQKLAGCRITRYHTDNWQSYAKFLPARRHRTGKESTSRIERHNLNFQTRLKWLQRHTICYSKSAAMHDAVIKLYAHHSTAGHHHF
jgi:insertion element IS1 protein InsB